MIYFDLLSDITDTVYPCDRYLMCKLRYVHPLGFQSALSDL